MKMDWGNDSKVTRKISTEALLKVGEGLKSGEVGGGREGAGRKGGGGWVIDSGETAWYSSCVSAP